MSLLNLIELLLLAALWGASFLFVRIAAPVLRPVLLIELRLLFAGLALLLLSIRLNLLSEIRRQLIPLAIVGCIGSLIPFLLFAFASLYLSAGFTAILNATAPLFGTILALVWLRDRVTLGQFLGLILGFAGVTILVGWTSGSITQSYVWATTAGLLGSLMYAIAAAYIKQKLSGVNSIAVATGSQLSAAIVLLPITPFFLPSTPPSIRVILVVMALALLSTALAYILYFHLISSVGIEKALTVGYLVPLFATIWGAMLLQEPITASMILGGILILSGTAIAVLPP